MGCGSSAPEKAAKTIPEIAASLAEAAHLGDTNEFIRILARTKKQYYAKVFAWGDSELVNLRGLICYRPQLTAFLSHL